MNPIPPIQIPIIIITQPPIFNGPKEEKEESNR